MGFVFAFLALLVAVFIAALILLIVESIYYDATHTEIFPGVEQPTKLRIIHAFTVGYSLLGRILENLHICTELQFVRFLQDTMRRGKDSTVCTEDVKFKHVPVRIYRPKGPSAGPRKGIVYFHGGGWMFGSIERPHAQLLSGLPVPLIRKMHCKKQPFKEDCKLTFQEDAGIQSNILHGDTPWQKGRDFSPRRYRLAPENPFPTPINDCLAATTHFLETAEHYGVDDTRIVLAGDSVGGNMAAAICQTLVRKKGLPKIRAQILIYPPLQAVDLDLPSFQQNRAVPFLYREKVSASYLQYAKGETSLVPEVLRGLHVPTDLKLHFRKWLSADNIPKEFKVRGYKAPVPVSADERVHKALKSFSTPEFSPLLAEDAVIRHLPETCLVTCEYDVLRDDGLLYKKRLEDHGVRVTWHHMANGFHGVVSFFDWRFFFFPSGKKAMDEVVKFIKSL